MEIEASHKLTNYNGKCSKLHGHSYQIFLLKKVRKLQKNNISIDFAQFKIDRNYRDILTCLLNKLDHTYLNVVFAEKNPTAEFIARWIYDFINKLVKRKFVIAVKETHNSLCVYDGKNWYIGADNL